MMDGPVAARYSRLAEVPTMPSGAELLRGASRSTQARSESSSGRHPRDVQRPLRLREAREELKLGRGDGVQPLQLFRDKELQLHCAAREEPPARASAVQPAQAPLGLEGSRGACPPQNLEEYVQQDLDAFWRWCPTPADGLHRCGLLVKLFDYCGLTRKDHKVSAKVRRLDGELRTLGVVLTEQVEAHQRVPYEAFVQSRRLREAVVKCSGVRHMWDQKRRPGKPSAAETRAPLAVWVLSVISMEGAAPGGLDGCKVPASPGEAAKP